MNALVKFGGISLDGSTGTWMTFCGVLAGRSRERKMNSRLLDGNEGGRTRDAISHAKRCPGMLLYTKGGRGKG